METLKNTVRHILEPCRVVILTAVFIYKVNRMIRQLSKFASEVTRVAQEGVLKPTVAVHRGITGLMHARPVGTKGILGGQAVVDGVQGIWDELTRNVNVSLSISLPYPRIQFYFVFPENGC